MKDTFLALALIGGVVGGYFYLTDGQLAPEVGRPSVEARKDFVWKNVGPGTKHGRKGGRYGKGSDSSHADQAQGFGAGEGIAGNDSEIEGLTSIYPVKKRAGESRSAKVAANGKSARAAKKRKVVHGVAVEAWAAAQQNRIALHGKPQAPPKGLRVFLQCMELKKQGPEALNQRQCESLLVRHQASDPDENRLSRYMLK